MKTTTTILTIVAIIAVAGAVAGMTFLNNQVAYASKGDQVGLKKLSSETLPLIHTVAHYTISQNIP